MRTTELLVGIGSFKKAPRSTPRIGPVQSGSQPCRALPQVSGLIQLLLCGATLNTMLNPMSSLDSLGFYFYDVLLDSDLR